jgi:PhoPQ-activated pathogenicity-related protein
MKIKLVCIVFVYTFALLLTQNKMVNKKVKTVKIIIPNDIDSKRMLINIENGKEKKIDIYHFLKIY